MISRTKKDGVRFLAGLLVGGIVASILLGLLLQLAAALVPTTVPAQVSTMIAALVIVALGIADLANRTPHVWRQVPQALVRRLPPGRLGVIWGMDLYLLVTTQKTTSLIWAGLVGMTLISPSHAWLLPLVVTVLGTLTIVLRSVSWSPSHGTCDIRRPWFVPMRRAAGAGLVVLGSVLLAKEFIW
jgi:hypothetical protein